MPPGSGSSHDEVLELLSGEFGMPVAALGRAAASRFDPLDARQCQSGQASFHLDLDIALLGLYGRGRRPRALVADAARGLEFADDVLRVRRFTEGHFLPPRDIRRHLRAEYDASAEARHPQLLEYAAELAAHGYSVVGVPDLRIDPRMDVFRRVNLDFGFCNVLPGAAPRPAGGVPLRLRRDGRSMPMPRGGCGWPVFSPFRWRPRKSPRC